MSLHYLIDPFTIAGDIIDVSTAELGLTDATGSTVIRVPDGVAIHTNPTNLADLFLEKYDGLLAFYAGFPQIFADPCMFLNLPPWDDRTADLAASSGLLASSGFVNHCLLAGGNYFSTVHNGVPGYDVPPGYALPRLGNTTGATLNDASATYITDGVTPPMPGIEPNYFIYVETGLNAGVYQVLTVPLETQLTVTPAFPSNVVGMSYRILSASTQVVLTWESYRFTDNDDRTERFQRVYDETADLTCQVSFNGGVTFNPTTDGAVLNIPVPDQGASLQVQFFNPAGYRVYLGSWALIF